MAYTPSLKKKVISEEHLSQGYFKTISSTNLFSTAHKTPLENAQSQFSLKTPSNFIQSARSDMKMSPGRSKYITD